MKLLNWLQDWCILRHIKNEGINLSEVINIGTIDNPGWYITINIDCSNFELKTFNILSIDNGDDDWISIKINEGVFIGVGDKNKLTYILEFFRKWYKKEKTDDTITDIDIDKNDLLYWIQNNWFCTLDFGWDGMEYHGIKINMNSNKLWKVEIELSGTYLEEKEFNNINIHKNDNDWVNINVSNNIFNGSGDKDKLVFIVAKFKEWAEMFKN